MSWQIPTGWVGVFADFLLVHVLIHEGVRSVNGIYPGELHVLCMFNFLNPRVQIENVKYM